MKNHTIAFLATGDEVVRGDILNTNSQAIAQTLVLEGFTVGNHLSTSDDEKDMNNSLRFLLAHHQVVITIGGLGPTSDDKTRNVISTVWDKPLVFSPESWERVVNRLTSFKLSIPESNRQQAYFPEGADIFPNDNGTADGCVITEGHQIIFMLPGPPVECLPMFNNFVLPYLREAMAKNPETQYHWRLFGVSEADIAEKLDAIVSQFRGRTGYRIDYPYVEFKLYVDTREDSTKLLKRINDFVKPYLLAHKECRASTLLREKLKTFHSHLTIEDKATGGYLETKLFHHDTCNTLSFENISVAATIFVKISGLKEFWAGQRETGETTLYLVFSKHGNHEEKEIVLPYRVIRIIDYTVELVSYEILQFLWPEEFA